MAEPAHTTSTGHPAEGGHGTFPPFQSETFASQLVWLAIAFVLLYVLMTKLALPRIGSIIAGRQKHIADDIAEASRLKGESDAAVAAYEKALADARARAQAIANETREQHAAEAGKRRKTLEDALNTRLADAEKTIAATKKSAMSNVRGIAEDAARAIVERLIGEAPSEKT
ncbi:MAG: F0F1 ATP synthase subunit B, partial [Pseudolabrys sp.]